MINSSQIHKQISEMRTLSLQIDRYKAVETLLDRHLTTLFSVVPVCLILKEVGGRILRINELSSRLLGLDPMSVVGKNEAELWGPENAQKWAEEDQMIVRTRQPLLGLIDRIELSTGEPRLFVTSKMPIFFNGDPVTQILVHTLDVTGMLPKICERAQADWLCAISKLEKGLGDRGIDKQDTSRDEEGAMDGG